MEEFIAILSALIASAVVIGMMILLAFLDTRMNIKSYNKRHHAQYDVNTNPFKMGKKYQDWYVENFANMKEGSNNENEK